MDAQQPFNEDTVPGEPSGAVSDMDLGVLLAHALAAAPAAGLDYAAAARALVHVRELSAWTEACRARLIERICATADVAIPRAGGTSPTNQVESSLIRASAIAEIACALSLSEGTAARLANTSEQLVSSFSATLEQMETGQIGAQHAAVIVDQAGSIPADAQPDFESRLLSVASGLTRAELGSRARRTRERMHPESITPRRAKAACDRRVDYERERDGMAWLGAYLPAEAVVSGYNRITAAARSLQGPQEKRTLTQLRADVFTDLLVNAGVRSGTERIPFSGDGNRGADPHCTDSNCVKCVDCADSGGAGNTGGARRGACGGVRANARASACPAASIPGQLCGDATCRACNSPDPAEMEQHGGPSEGTTPYYEGIQAQVLVTVPVFALMGLTDEPAELEGYGPIPADVARKLAAGAESFTRILTHPETGAMLSFGSATYKVPAHLKRAVRVRDPYCNFAGCRTSAMHCELDHVNDWHWTGPTSYSNIKPACKKHHRLKHHGGWKARPGPHGILHWQSPAALNYSSTPEGHALGEPDPHHRPYYLLNQYRAAQRATTDKGRSDTNDAGDAQPETDSTSPPQSAAPPF